MIKGIINLYEKEAIAVSVVAVVAVSVPVAVILPRKRYQQFMFALL